MRKPDTSPPLSVKIKTEGLNVLFGKKQILKQVGIQIRARSITAIVGQSGCGKSTLLKSLNRIVEEGGGTIEGTILLDGEPTDSIEKEKLRKQIGLVFQQPVAFPFSIEKNLSYVLDYHFCLKKEEKSSRIESCLKAARLYEEVRNSMKMPASNLSGGQKQRLAIARCLCAEPEVLLLDEPCSALDMKNTLAIEETLLELKKDYAIVIVTHNLAQAHRIADQVIFMHQGEAEEQLPKGQFFENPSSQLAREYIQYM